MLRHSMPTRTETRENAPPQSPASAPSAQHPPSNLVVVLLIALLCLVWGSTWLVIAGGLRDLPPFTGAATRFVVAALLMSAIAPSLARREGGTKPALGLSLAVGLLNFAASYGIVYWGETRLPSGLASILWSVFPMLMAISGAWFLAGERISKRQALGFAIGFAGVALLFATDLRALSNDAVLTGLVFLLSPIVSCVGTTILKKHGKHTSSALLNRNAMWIGALVLGVLALSCELPTEARWTLAAAGSVAYLSIVGTVLTFTLYFWLLRHVAAYRMSMIAYITPAIALTLGTLVRDEPLTRFTIAGSATILAGVVLVVRAPRRRVQAP